MAELHPQIVHVTIILALVGVAFRLLSLTGRAAWASPAAALLLIGAAVSSIPSVQSGIDAHGPVERVPGARPAVVEPEEWGERARNVLLVLGAIELLGLALRKSPKVKLVHGAAAAVGLVAAFAVYEAGEHGGELVYSYAGGIGIRSGDPKDVERLLVAATYHQAQADRKAGRAEDAAGLIAQTARRFPADPEMQMFAAESLLLDQKNAQGALDALAAVTPPDGNRILIGRKATLQADAYEAAGQKDQAIAVLEKTVAAFPSPRMQQRLDALKGGAAK
ncbi:MAG: hypothetical protein IT181_25520 [Acidobacteria bacterium]|nr:hypothetical protein [Acidobacteriota bacterium]